MVPDVTAPADERRPLRVSVGHRPPAPMTAYVDQIVGDDLSEVEFTFFMGSYRARDVDVVHVCDVDAFLGGRDRKPAERVAAATEAADDLRDRGIALVRTVVGPERPDDEALAILDRVTSTFVALDEVTPTPDPRRTVVIPHAHHRDRFLGYPRGEQVPGRILCVARAGVGRAAEGPLKVLSVTDTPDLSLRIAGEEDPTLETLLPRAIRRSRGRVTARTETLSDAEVIREVDGAELVVLPAIDSLVDQGLLFTVLSMDRPVLLPDGAAARRLAEEVGPGWVLTHDGPITAEVLDEAVSELRGTERDARPNLAGRGLETTVAAYAEVHRAATARAV
ncbi:GDP-mannose--glycolipid 4-beta-D-mannosyltransferase [Nesterenkonia halobia]|uniref:GDP-mannose--glycolipid 4-beta-D-mannosyltransferase n=1 Tax=Nesterenkonia halobia TaxID=37922 RepID=A0ABP6REW8_9MICC